MAANRDVLVPPTGKRERRDARDRSCSAPRFSRPLRRSQRRRDRAFSPPATCPSSTAPRSNALLGCGPRPWRTCARQACRVGLGTDSPASTPSFDPWEELRTALYASRARERRADALERAGTPSGLATLGAARALGLDAEARSLTPGKRPT